MNENVNVADLKVKLKAVEKRVEDVAYERNGLQPRSQLSQSGQDKVGECFNWIQDKINCFSARLKEVQEYMEN